MSIADGNLREVNIVDLDPDGRVIVIACSNATNDLHVVRVYYVIDQVCPADMNLDGSLNHLDIALFVKMLSEQRDAADLDRDGEFDFQDWNCYLTFIQVVRDSALGVSPCFESKTGENTVSRSPYSVGSVGRCHSYR